MTTTVATPKPAKNLGKAAVAGGFTMPAISPMIPPPPYRYRNTKALNVLFTTDPQILPKLVPAPLEPDPEQPLVFYIGHFQFADFDLPYNEAGLLVPVRCNGEGGLYAVVLYLDKANPIIGGREIYGWPKKEAEEVLFQEEGGKITAGVTRYGRRIIAASFGAQQKVESIPARPKAPIYLLKLIPSLQQDAPPDVWKLNSLVIDPDVITELQVGTATLQFGESPLDAFLAEIPVKQVLYSEVIVHDFTLGYGQVVHDYLAEK